jgi:integrase
VKINSRTVAALKLPTGKSDHIGWDAELIGFGVRVRRGADGQVRRSFIAQYRHGKQTRRIKLDAGNALTAEQARTAAKAILAKVALGEDPQAERHGRRDARSLRSVVDEFLTAKRATVRPTTFRGLHAYLTGGYFRPLHTTTIDQISRADVAARLVAITREHSANTAMHCRGKLGALFAWAVQMGLVDTNPVIGTIRPEGSKARERLLTDAELAKIWAACGDDDHGKIVRLAALLGQRRGEIGGMCWSEVDLGHSTWTIPSSRAKNGRSHTLPLPPLAMQIIESVPRMVGRDYLFGVRAEGGFVRWSQAKAALDDRAGIADTWVLHDLRRATATGLANLGVAPHVVEAILNHQTGTRNAIARTYNKSNYENETRAAMVLWSDHIGALTSGGPRKIAIVRPTRKRAA